MISDRQAGGGKGNLKCEQFKMFSIEVSFDNSLPLN
jgi:hypothetical protein